MALQDKIGREESVNKVCGLVDTLQKDQNFCLSINGVWGSGKSFVLQMIEEKLSKRQEYVIVKYDAWNNSFYSDPLIAILSCIIDGVDEKLYLIEQHKEKIKKAAKTTANTLEKVSSKIFKLKAVTDGIKEIIQNFHNPIDMKLTGDFKSYQKLLKETKGVLNEITQKGEYREKQTKLIILVDEIDRCLPDEQLKILERLHHLFDIKNCSVIIALNKVAIQNTFEKNYGGKSEDYFRKFFQYNFQLSVNAVTLLKNKLIDLFYELNDKRQEAIIENGVDFIIEDLIKVTSEIVDKGKENNIDNRDIEKYISVSKKIVFTILNCHPALIWFAMQMLLYRMLSNEHYSRLVDIPKDDNQIILDLCPYHRKDINESSYQQIYRYTYRERQTYTYTYKYYNKGFYNDLQFLFNICRYRENDSWVESFIKSIRIPSFLTDNYTISQLIEQIKKILAEIDSYGDR
ncbi:MAG: KAP family NTPase [Clostridia bacterium]|nr:KAP family NTPase [Clostridia bacterium]